MEWAIAIVVVVAIIGLSLFGILLYKKQTQINNLQQQLEQQKQNVQQLTDNTAFWQTNYNQALEQCVSLQNDKSFLQVQLDNALAANQQKENELTARYEAVSQNVAAAEEKLAHINDQIIERTTELNNIAARFNDQYKAFEDVVTKNAAAASELEGYKVELQQIIQELDNAKETSRATLLKDYKNEGKWFDFQLSNKELTLIKTIAEISALYPELTKDLATIEWKKVWLPKVQNIANVYGLATRGIYRLVLKSDEKVCYIGQAVNIKERWYEHIKKMIGADSKGNEKVYDYRPEDFYWSLVEMGSSDLNKSEKYWIEYYCCKEVGLNKKL